MRNRWRDLVVALLLLACGCTSNLQKAHDETESGEVALGGNRYDDAVADADTSLKEAPTAKAYYVRARAEEDRPKPDANITTNDLAKARADYQAALDMNPSSVIVGRCRAGLANVAFDLEDYQTAITGWQSALDDLEEPEWRALALYHIGISQQRLGQFDEADKTFQNVIAQYPDQEVATTAQGRQGIRGFYVQLGAFTTIPDAQAAIDKAKTAGVTCRQASDQGLFAVRAGLFPTYAKARQAQATLAAQFPGAVIGP